MSDDDAEAETAPARVTVVSDEPEETQQLNLGTVPKTLVRAFRRLADLESKTLSQWAIDELEAAVLRERDQTRRYYEQAAERARAEQDEHERLVDQLAEKLERQPRRGSRTRRSGRRAST